MKIRPECIHNYLVSVNPDSLSSRIIFMIPVVNALYYSAVGHSLHHDFHHKNEGLTMKKLRQIIAQTDIPYLTLAAIRSDPHNVLHKIGRLYENAVKCGGLTLFLSTAVFCFSQGGKTRTFAWLSLLLGCLSMAAIIQTSMHYDKSISKALDDVVR